MQRVSKYVVAVVAAVVAAVVPVVSGAQSIRVAGFGQGCFYLIGATPCTNFSNNAFSSSVLAGTSLSYTGGTASSTNFDDFSSDGFIGIGGSPNNFGTLTTGNVSFNYGTATPLLGFRLLVAFGQPSGVAGVQPVNAIVSGSTRAGGGGGVFYNFDDALQGPFPFVASHAAGANPGDPTVAGGAGTLLTFGVNDMSVLNNQTASVTGNVTLQVTTPEPASIVLMGTGVLSLAGLGYLRRRNG